MTDTKEKETKETTELQTGQKTQHLPMHTPFGLVRRFAEDLEKLFEDFDVFRFPSLVRRELFPLRSELEKVAWVPQVEVLHKNDQFIVRADLPGLKKDDIKVELTDELLTISGERKEEKEEKREGYYRSERSYGSFYRQIPLPEGAKTDKVEANFSDGVLEIAMAAPKLEPRSRRVEINAPAEAVKAKAAAN